MKRSEACGLLSKIAQNELIDLQVSKDILKARDIVVCKPHKVLDVIATGATRKRYMNILADYIDVWTEDRSCIAFDIRKQLYELRKELRMETLEDCTEVYLHDRCDDCPLIKGMNRYHD